MRGSKEPRLCRRRARAAAILAIAAIGSTAAACKSTPRDRLPAAAPRTGHPVRFAWETVDGHKLDTSTTLGRTTVIGFVTTYDVASQAQVRYLATVAKNHTPRINVALLVLEPPENRELVEAWVAALGLPFDVALADPDTIAGRGPFTNLHHVPAIVVLDREGREAWRRLGLVDSPTLEAALRDIEAGPPAAK